MTVLCLDFEYHEVRVTQAIIENSRQVLLVADHSKFDRPAMVRLGSIGQVDALITDCQPPEHITGLLEEKNVTLHTAGHTTPARQMAESCLHQRGIGFHGHGSGKRHQDGGAGMSYRQRPP